MTASGELGKTIDGSRGRGTALDFQLGAGFLVKGLEAALPLMSRGQRAWVVVPPSEGYGERGHPPVVPPNATLVYDIELISMTD